MPASLVEQRNPYQGDPPRPWIIVRLAAKDGGIQELKLLADTGSPFELVIGDEAGAALSHEDALEVDTNFGVLRGVWFQLAMPEFGSSQKIYGYSSDEVRAAVESSHLDFQGLAGLPLLRLFEYGGDANEFWIRRPSN